MSPAKKPTSRKSTAKSSKKAAAKKTTRKPTKARAATKKTTAKKAAPKKTAAKKATAKKTTAKKPAARKGATPKASPKKTTAKKPVAKKSTAKKTAVKKPVAKKPPVNKAGPKKLLPRPAPKPPPKRPVRPMKLDAKILGGIKTQLQEEYEALERQYAELDRESFEGTQSDLSGEVGLDEDFADAGSATFERERDLSIQNNIKDLMEQIERALRRIDDGIYGTCERCGNPIEAARLKALPHASLCMDCKRREERAR